MHFSTLIQLSATFAAVVVQVTAAQFNVTVGGSAGLVFTPEFVTASPGDTIFFTFQQKNHTVTQSTLASPCQQSPGGFDSGYMPVAADNTNGPFPAAQLTVKDENPVWVYCRQANHCQQGMVFAVNPGDKFDMYKANAMGNSTSSLPPSSTPPSTTTPPSPSPTSTGTDHRVIVGGSTLTFQPDTVAAQPGDTVTFEFHQKNHTATQSTFANPCMPMSGGFNSGYEPVGTDATTFPTYTVPIKDTTPVWVFCQQANHCSQGMVFAVNAPSTGNTFDAFKAKAMGGSSSSGGSPSGTTSPSPTSTQSGAAGKTQIQSIAGLSVVVFTSLFFLL